MGADGLDHSELLSRAEMEGHVWYMKPGWRKWQVFAGVLCCLLILTIPLGIWIIVKAKKARVGLTEEGFAFTYLGSVSGRWSEVESITPVGMGSMTFGGGLVGLAVASTVKARTEGLKGPLHIKMKGRRTPKIIPAHTIDRSLEMALEMERLSGIEFLPREGEGGRTG